MQTGHILLVRLGAMGDIIHALPAAATLKHNFPGCKLTWAVEPKWAPLLDSNPYVDRLLLVDRRTWSGLQSAWNNLTADRFDTAIDLQGLIKSAVLTRLSRAPRRIGLHHTQAREPLAARFYTLRVEPRSAHIVDRYLEIVQAAGATRLHPDFPIPPGHPEGVLPDGPFVLACPLAGWTSKQWPAEYYSKMARSLRAEGATLVVNGPPSAREALEQITGAHPHLSGIPGLIEATRRAAAVIGVDSGPLHLAAALSKPGVALFGPTDPARNGPYRSTITVLRHPNATTTYKRADTIDPSMRALLPEMVLQALRPARSRA